MKDQTLQVKIEELDFQAMQQQLNVAKSVKMQLEKLYSQALDVKVVMQQKATLDRLYDAKLKDYSEACDCLNAFLGEAAPSCTRRKATLKDAVAILDNCMAHSDGIKSLIKRSKAMF